MSKIPLDDMKERLAKRKAKHSNSDNPQSFVKGLLTLGIKRKLEGGTLNESNDPKIQRWGVDFSPKVKATQVIFVEGVGTLTYYPKRGSSSKYCLCSDHDFDAIKFPGSRLPFPKDFLRDYKTT